MRYPFFVLLVLLIGCDNRAPEDAGPGDAAVDACTTCFPDSGMRDGGPPPDGNDTFTAATMFTPGTMSSGVIATPGDLDYFKFEGTAGQWVRIWTSANPFDDDTKLDTVVTLYDSAHTQIAENDDVLPRDNTDSEIITRLPSTGTYYILLQEYSTWAADPAEGNATYTYQLHVDPLEPAPAGVSIDAEGGDDVASAQATGGSILTGTAYTYVAGTMRDTSDLDVFSFSIAAGGSAFSVAFMPEGNLGTGSTGRPQHLWITDMAGTSILARIETTAPEDITLEPNLLEGTYLLWVDHPATAGANDFYVLKMQPYTDNPAETREMLPDTNGDPSTAELIPFGPRNGTTRSGFILAHLPTTDPTPTHDVDYYSIAVQNGESVSITCGSRTSGSGVVGLTATLLDSTGATTVTTAMETPPNALRLMSPAVTADTTYLVRLTKTSQDPEVTGDYVRCGFHLALP